MKILLLSDLPPCTNHTSGLLINRQCDFILERGDSLYGYIVKDVGVSVEIPDDKIAQISFNFINKPRETWGIGKLGAFGSYVGDAYVSRMVLPGIRKSIIRFAQENEIDMIWSPIQGQTMVRLVRIVAEELKIPYIVQIFDPINWWFQAKGVDAWTQRSVMREFDRMIRHSQCLLAASKNMADTYRFQYKCPKAIPMMMPIDPIEIPTRSKSSLKDTFTIALTGQLYAYGSILALLNVLKEMNWKCCGKKIVFRIYGGNMHFDINSPCNMEYCGWVPQDRLLKELQEVDLLYCPYRFDGDFEETARLAFPGKLSTYMCTGVPVLVHGPCYSSTVSFIKEKNAGYALDSIEASEIKSMLQKIVADPNRYQRAMTAASVLEKELSSAVMKRNLYRALEL